MKKNNIELATEFNNFCDYLKENDLFAVEEFLKRILNDKKSNSDLYNYLLDKKDAITAILLEKNKSNNLVHPQLVKDATTPNTLLNSFFMIKRGFFAPSLATGNLGKLSLAYEDYENLKEQRLIILNKKINNELKRTKYETSNDYFDLINELIELFQTLPTRKEFFSRNDNLVYNLVKQIGKMFLIEATQLKNKGELSIQIFDSLAKKYFEIRKGRKHLLDQSYSELSKIKSKINYKRWDIENEENTKKRYEKDAEGAMKVVGEKWVTCAFDMGYENCNDKQCGHNHGYVQNVEAPDLTAREKAKENLIATKEKLKSLQVELNELNQQEQQIKLEIKTIENENKQEDDKHELALENFLLEEKISRSPSAPLADDSLFDAGNDLSIISATSTTANSMELFSPLAFASAPPVQSEDAVPQDVAPNLPVGVTYNIPMSNKHSFASSNYHDFFTNPEVGNSTSNDAKNKDKLSYTDLHPDMLQTDEKSDQDLTTTTEYVLQYPRLHWLSNPDETELTQGKQQKEEQNSVQQMELPKEIQQAIKPVSHTEAKPAQQMEEQNSVQQMELPQVASQERSKPAQVKPQPVQMSEQKKEAARVKDVLSFLGGLPKVSDLPFFSRKKTAVESKTTTNLVKGQKKAMLA